MGLEESETKINYVPETDRSLTIREALTEEFETLLTQGGVITRGGTILALPLGEISQGFPPEIAEEINEKHVAKVNLNRIKGEISKIVDLSHSSSYRGYVFSESSINYLSYKTHRGGGIMPLMISTRGERVGINATNQNHFGTAFSKRIKSVLDTEGIPGSNFRFAAEILKELADTQGLGSIDSEKAQEAIRIGKENIPQSA